VSQRGVGGLRDEIVAGLEVPVEPPMGQPGLLHQVGHAHVVDPVAPDSACCRIHNSLVAGGFVCLGAAHPLDLPRFVAGAS